MPTSKDIKKPSQERARVRRHKILLCAHDLLAREGAAAVTTTSIAQEAEIPVGSIYRYFTDKEAILSELYDTAYAEVETEVLKTLEGLERGLGFRETHSRLIHAFWRAARSHPSFRLLTRWANSQRSLWDVTPGPDSNLGQMVIRTLEVAETTLPAARRDVMLRTTVTTLSVLVDQAIEEDDEQVAAALIEELATLLAAYIE
ncbi:MAG: TetR/AcrR family transcriptional regulator [Alphaproteobacteria bacterium]|nr:TetR/AcrR family transcriptional regulator [Alphaproteobacteria bacterium]